MGRSSYRQKVSGWRNRLAPEDSQTATCFSSLSSCSIEKVELRFEFGAQELSNDVFNGIVRRRENRLWYMANQTDGTAKPKITTIQTDGIRMPLPFEQVFSSSPLLSTIRAGLSLFKGVQITVDATLQHHNPL